MDSATFYLGLEATAFGLGGVFLVLILFYGIIKLLLLLGKNAK